MYPQVVYKGRVFTVELDAVQVRGGKEVEVAVVRHRPSVVIVPFDDQGRIVMIRQYRHALGRHIWEVPAGNIEIGETPDAAAVRECEEEIGLVPSAVERLGAFFPLPGYCDEEMIFYRAIGLKPPAPDSRHRPDEDEEIESHAMAPSEAKLMVGRGTIVDLKTAYALTLI